MPADVAPIGRALISVSDKTGLVELAQALERRGVEIVSTGGTAAALARASVSVVDVAQVTGFQGKIVWDSSKPDGTPRKLMDVSRLTNLGWKAKIDLKTGVAMTYQSYLSELASGKLRS